MKLPSISRKVLSIDFGADEIKIVEGQVSRKGLNIFKSISVKLPQESYSDGTILDRATIVELLKSSLNENKISTELAYGIINSGSIITREVSIPKVEEKEVAAVIGFQMENFFPVDPEDYVVNHIILGGIIEDDIEKLSIFIIGIPKVMVVDHLELMKEVGLKPRVLDFQGNTMAKLLDFNDKVNGDYNTRDIIFASVDMGYDSTKLSIIRNGNMEITRILDVGAKTLYNNIVPFFDYSLDEIEQMILGIEGINGGEDFTDHNRFLNIIKSTMESLFEQMEMILRYYRTRNMDNNINLILLQGGLSNIKGLDNLYSNYFNIPTVVLKSLDKIKYDGELSKYSNAIGGLIRIDEV